MNLRAPRGTRDILPPSSDTWNNVEKRIKDIYFKANFREIRTPLFEETELFVRGVGGTTDIVEKEMYTFNDKGGRSITLRPEGTAPVVRAYLEHKLYGQPQPFKFFYFGPMFRYERPQAGRYRQHYQTGVEVLGGDAPLIDAEVINLGIDILKEFGLENYQLHLNSIGCRECRPKFEEELREFFRKETVCPECTDRIERNPLRILDCKNLTCGELKTRAPRIIDYLCKDCSSHFQEVQNLLQMMGINFVIDPSLVRGLDYYTRTAFEIKSSELGAQDTILGGGRYDGLAEELGGPRAPGMGFGLGLDRFILMMEKSNKQGNIERPLDVYLISIGDQKVQQAGWKVLCDLRAADLAADMDFLSRSPKNQMKTADRTGCRFSIIIGSRELETGVVQLKDMHQGTQLEVKITEIIPAIKGENRGG